MSGGYDPSYFPALFDVEDRHFWFTTRNLALEAVIGPLAAQLPARSRVLEIGCGTGKTLQALAVACPNAIIVGMDLLLEGLEYARRRTEVPLVQGTIEHAPFARAFDLVGMFDVLEHIDDDAASLREVHALVAPGRHLVITVPAHNALWSGFDDESHHCRRYEPDELRERLAAAGFEVEYLTLFMATLYPIVRLRRGMAEIVRRGRRRLALTERSAVLSDIKVRPVVNGLLGFALKQEIRFLRLRWQLPLGTSLLAVARRLP